MRVLYFSQYFPPEVGATQTRASEMSRYLAERGHRVTVVTEVPNHPSGIIPPEYRGRLSERRVEDGVDVLRLWVWASPEKTFKSRMRFYLSYMAMAGLAGSLLRGRYDLVYATSPPLFVGAAGAVAAIVRRVPFVFEVRDLWPESAVALGELSSRRAIRAAEKLERFLYSRAAKIVVVTQGIRRRLMERGLPEDKLALIPNGANTDLFRFDEAGRAGVRQTLGLEGKFVVMYAGIHGLAQGLENLVDAARLLQEREDIEFIFVGEGPKKAELVHRKNELGLRNVTFLPEVPAEQMPAYLSAADCSIVPLRDEPVFYGARPSKMFEAWACSRPVVLSAAGEAEEALRQAGGGLAVPPEDAAAIARAVKTLASDPAGAREMGQRGRLFVESHYSRREQARLLESLLASLESGFKS
jgi:colanic acid biosynthesis glycosyl transferase WcaI